MNSGFACYSAASKSNPSILLITLVKLQECIDSLLFYAEFVCFSLDEQKTVFEYIKIEIMIEKSFFFNLFLSMQQYVFSSEFPPQSWH